MATIALRVDDSLKKEASALFKDLGIDMSTAVKMFLIQAVRAKALPFEVKSREVRTDEELIDSLSKKISTVRVSIDDKSSIEEFFGDEDFSEYEGVFDD